MFDLILYQPEIPPNTGNVIRLSANSGCRLHLIEPLGFALDDARVKRAGLDYHEMTEVQTHPSLDSFLHSCAPTRLFTISTKNPTRYDQARFSPGDAFIFGPETRGLPDQIRQSVGETSQLYLPMQTSSRSLNLSNAVAIIVYEAWRQCRFMDSNQI